MYVIKLIVHPFNLSKTHLNEFLLEVYVNLRNDKTSFESLFNLKLHSFKSIIVLVLADINTSWERALRKNVEIKYIQRYVCVWCVLLKFLYNVALRMYRNETPTIPPCFGSKFI